MEEAKNVVKEASGATSKSQFEQGHQVPIQHQKTPGLQASMRGQQPETAQIPTEEGGYQTYKAAGKLLGKRAVITGGDSGIGRAVAVLFAMEGASSLITYLPAEEKDAQTTKEMVQKYGGHCYLLPTDVRKRENCKIIIDMATEKLGGIDILVNNAATQRTVSDISDLDEEQWVETFNTNIHPYYFLAKYALPYLNSGSTIINCASVNPYIGRGDLLDYTSTKGAIVAFTRALSNQQVSKGIRVNCVCPGPVWTPLIPSTMSREGQDQFSSCPMGRPGQLSEIATCFVFLASQDSSFMSGQCLHPNGGTIVNG
ncbi:hypothetical protein AJ80_00403 [Polytolypa hystricis UAMH7299]|uniref:Oxidoreductase n=1 Tax=Polytolypa hystricis (strain UAMH7299) TaxID=1447883 RepID=A0A2B7Z3P2_POLH7|nr:hypothetical protein AJ80_00403 [Polytolypa hystricis UAMH7299]